MRKAAPINVIVHPFFCFHNAPSETPTFIFYAYKGCLVVCITTTKGYPLKNSVLFCTSTRRCRLVSFGKITFKVILQLLKQLPQNTIGKLV